MGTAIDLERSVPFEGLRSPPTGQSLDRGLTRVTSSIVQVASRFLQIPSSPAPPHYIVSILPPPILEIQLGLEAYSEVASSRSSFFQIDRLDL